MDEIARLTPTFTRRQLREARPARQHPVALQRRAPGRHADHACRTSSCAARAGSWSPSTCRPREKVNARYPLILTTGRILSQYNVGAQTRRTANVSWHDEDRLEIHPHDAEERGIARGRLGRHRQPRRRHGAARASHRARAARRGLHDLPLPRIRRQRHHHRQLGLGDQLPRVQGHGGAGHARQPARPSGRSASRNSLTSKRRSSIRTRTSNCSGSAHQRTQLPPWQAASGLAWSRGVQGC